jgi:hypothetical protein
VGRNGRRRSSVMEVAVASRRPGLTFGNMVVVNHCSCELTGADRATKGGKLSCIIRACGTMVCTGCPRKCYDRWYLKAGEVVRESTVVLSTSVSLSRVWRLASDGCQCMVSHHDILEGRPPANRPNLIRDPTLPESLCDVWSPI